MPEWFSVLPPLLAIAVAIWKKEVVLALTLGIWLAETFLAVSDPRWHPPGSAIEWPVALLELAGLGFLGFLERCVAVFQDMGNARVLLFGLIVGALLELMRDSGGVAALVERLSGMGLTRSKRQVGILPTIIGMGIFVETSMSVLSAGVVSQKLFDKFGMSRARLAYIVDSTCAPISVLILFNGWGAYILGLLEGYELNNPVATLVASVPFNFYALLILASVWYTVLSTRVHGPMRQTEGQVSDQEVSESKEMATRARYMWAPLLLLVGGMVFFMWFTGEGNLLQGSGSKSVLWAVTLATVSLIILLAWEKVFEYREMIQISYKGMGKLLPVVLIMLLSFAIGASCKALETGPFVAGLVGDFLPAFLIAPLLFISAAIISFTTGTSWGTFAILIPVGIPLAFAMDLPPGFVLSAILGGGVFGDHCSPISDTTIISSLASGCDHLEHVRTQLPYAMTAAAAAVLIYMGIGLFL